MKKNFFPIIPFASTTAFMQNVGIGTTTPTSGKLEIVASETQLVTRAGDSQSGISHSISPGLSPGIGFNLPNVNAAFRFLGTGYDAIIQYSPSSGTMYFSTSQSKGNAGDISFFNNKSVAIDGNGYLGIGTPLAKTKLHVTSSMIIGPSTGTTASGYILSIAGKIICEELKVQLNAGWLDFVFDQHYNLPSLNLPDQKVMEEKHLPGIPSAKEIKAQQGITMGNMQKRLLEKVEELCHYVFEITRENQQLRQEIESLKKTKTLTGLYT